MSLFLRTSEGEHFIEHHQHYFDNGFATEIDFPEIPPAICFLKNSDSICFQVSEQDRKVHTGYYVGVDWITESKAIYVQPKLNKGQHQTDFIKMLFASMKHSVDGDEIKDLFEIKWDRPSIPITQEQDLLTPLLVMQFLSIVRIIVKKGLKKSYYKVENNLNARIKGKILISKTIKQNAVKNKALYNYCSYDEFGLNSLENRLLKKTLLFIKRYLPQFASSFQSSDLNTLFNYLTPAFETITDKVEVFDIKHSKTNVFYKEYGEAIRIAKLILKRFSYNISNAEKDLHETPPFWIDMSKLFELYVLGLLKDKFGGKILYHPTFNKKELDFLLLDPPMVIDTKYKPRYDQSAVLSDMRQLSGYSRLRKVYNLLNVDEKTIIDCLIIYPSRNSDHGNINLQNLAELLLEDKNQIKEYVGFYKISIDLPLQQPKTNNNLASRVQ